MSGPAGARPPSAFLEAWHLVVASALVVAQPLFALLGENAVFFVAHRAGVGHLLAFAFGLCLLPPAPLCLLRWALGSLWPRVGRLFQGLSLSGLGGLGLLPLVGRIDSGGDGLVPVGAALLFGLLLALAYRRFTAVRTFFTALSPVVLLFPLLFLFGSQARRLLHGSAAETVAELELAGRPPVLLVVFDELSLPTLLDAAGGINEKRYPGFAELAATSHWLRNASTVAQSTEHALPAILTGRYPRPGTLPIAADHPRSLFQLLGGSYEVTAAEPITHLCPPELCRGGERRSWPRTLLAIARDLRLVYAHVVLPAALAEDLPRVDIGWKDFERRQGRHDWTEDRREVVDRRLRELSEMRPGSFTFLHFALPHFPWEYLPSGTSYGSRIGALNTFGLASTGSWEEEEWLVLQGFQRYMLQLSYVDRIVGRILARLREAGVFEEALIVVTADHGTTFRPGHHRRRSSPQAVQDIVPVPLFVKLPGQREGTLSDRNVETIDILPTVAGVLGLAELPWPVDGTSALATGAERRGKLLYLSPAQGLRRKRLPASLRGRLRLSTLRTLELFGSSEEGIYALGPLPELLGKRKRKAGLRRTMRAAVALHGRKLYREVDPATGFVPARIVGRSRAPRQSQPRCLAVVVGGRVRATTRTFERRPGIWWFSAMVPEDAFTAGANRVEIFDVSDREPARCQGEPWRPSFLRQGFEKDLRPWKRSPEP